MRATHPMKSGFLVVLIILMTSTVCYGLDTDLYVVSGANIPPNVIIILDNSASMDDVSAGQIYDKTIDYSAYGPATVYPKDTVYIKTGSKWGVWGDVSATCESLKTLLIDFGEAINFSGCGFTKRDFQIGNFRNFLQLNGGPGGNLPRFGLANGILRSYINTTGGVRFSVMTFNNDTTGKTVKYNSGTKEEYVLSSTGL